MTVRLPAPGPIAGATALPAGFAHPHASEEARRIAEAGLILRPLAEVLDAVSETEARLAQLRDSACLADQPDRRWVDDWLHRSYLGFWASPR